MRKGCVTKWPKRIENEDLNYVWWYIQYFTLDRCSAVVLLLFGGRGKVSAIMGDFGKGLRNFKTGLKGQEEEADAGPLRKRQK